jgi:putative transposase
VTLGGRRVSVSRPRVRLADGREEVGLESYGEFSSRDVLFEVVAERMLAGVSTRWYRRTQEPVGREVEEEGRSSSKSAVSRAFVRRARTALAELLARRLDRLELVALMIDGLELDERCPVVALGVTIDGTKVPLGLWEGSTENTTTVTALLADLQDRGLGFDQPILCVIDVAKALSKAIRAVIGNHTPIQRCVVHYADARVMPTRVGKPRGGGRIRPVMVGIIRALRGRRGACRGVGSGLVWSRAAWSVPALAL